MVCPKCTFEFCWDCLDHFPDYKHDFGEDCPTRVVFMYGQLGFLFAFYSYRLISRLLIYIFQKSGHILAAASLFFLQTEVEK